MQRRCRQADTIWNSFSAAGRLATILYERLNTVCCRNRPAHECDETTPYSIRAQTMKFRLGLIISAWLLAWMPFLAHSEATVHSEATQEFMLKNGMKIIVKEDHRAPTVAHMIWYKIGSINKVNGTTGVAHVLEHMMFKGTKTLKPGEFSARVAALGGRENAFTSKDYTAYFQQIEKSRLGSVMALEADRMANLVFDKNEFAREIKVVMEERRWRTDDQPQQKVYEALNATAFEAHPYHHPIVGWMNDLQNMTVDDAKSWYDNWYGPNIATMVVTGDVDANQVRGRAGGGGGRGRRGPGPRAGPRRGPPRGGGEGV